MSGCFLRFLTQAGIQKTCKNILFFLNTRLFGISITFSSKLNEREAEMRPFSDLNLGMDFSSIFDRFWGRFGVQNRSKIGFEKVFEMSSQIKGPKMAPRRPKASNLGPTWGPRGVLNGVKKVLKSGLRFKSLLEPQLDPKLTPT